MGPISPSFIIKFIEIVKKLSALLLMYSMSLWQNLSIQPSQNRSAC